MEHLLRDNTAWHPSWKRAESVGKKWRGEVRSRNGANTALLLMAVREGTTNGKKRGKHNFFRKSITKAVDLHESGFSKGKPAKKKRKRKAVLSFSARREMNERKDSERQRRRPGVGD